jgi:hypothetical protein
MGIGTSIVLIAVGAILDHAVSVNARGFSIHEVGVILMIVGALGLIVSLFFWNTWDWGGFGGSRRTTVYEDAPRGRRVVEDRID